MTTATVADTEEKKSSFKKKETMNTDLANKLFANYVTVSKNTALYGVPTSIPIGLETLDWAIGIKDANGEFGFPTEGFVEIAGPESSGKSTHAIHLAVAALKKFPNRPVIYIDAEHTTDYNYLARFGLTPENCIRIEPHNIGEIHKIFAMATKMDNPPSLIVLDSIPAVNLGERLAATIKLGERAGFFSDLLARWNTPINEAKVLVVLVNQLRENIQTDQYKTSFAMQKIENDYKTTGGWALRFFFTTRLFLQPIKFVKVKMHNWATNETQETTVAVKIKAHVVKNKKNPDADKYRVVEYYLNLITGLDRVHSLISTAIKHQVIKQAGSHYTIDISKSSLEGDKISAQGEQALIKKVREMPPAQQEMVLQALLQGMKWDELHHQVVDPARYDEGVIEESFEGNTVVRSVSSELIEQAKKKSTAIEQALLLGLVVKKARRFVFQSVSATTLEKLWQAMSTEQKTALQTHLDELLSGEETVITEEYEEVSEVEADD